MTALALARRFAVSSAEVARALPCSPRATTDTLVGTRGPDIFTGGDGADTFVYSFNSTTGAGLDGRDTITDLAAAETLRFDDVLDAAISVAILDTLVTVSTVGGTDTLIHFDTDTDGIVDAGEGTITLVGVSGFASLTGTDPLDGTYTIDIV